MKVNVPPSVFSEMIAHESIARLVNELAQRTPPNAFYAALKERGDTIVAIVQFCSTNSPKSIERVLSHNFSDASQYIGIRVEELIYIKLAFKTVSENFSTEG